MSKKVKVEGEEVKGKVEEAQGETYEATADGFFQWCGDRGIQVPMLFMSDYCDIEITRRKFKEFSAQNEALGHALNELRRKYFDNIKWFLTDCADGVTRESVRNRGSLSHGLRSLWLGYAKQPTAKLSPRQQRLIEKYTRKPDEVEAIRREQEARRVSKIGTFLRSKGASSKGEARGQKEEGR